MLPTIGESINNTYRHAEKAKNFYICLCFFRASLYL
jgi:hypothetical protein